MVNLIQPRVQHIHTRDGEVQVSITIDLNLNLNTDGLVLAASQSKGHSPYVKEEEDEINYEIPSFKNKGLVKFGKKVKE